MIWTALILLKYSQKTITTKLKVSIELYVTFFDKNKLVKRECNETNSKINHIVFSFNF